VEPAHRTRVSPAAPEARSNFFVASTIPGGRILSIPGFDPNEMILTNIIGSINIIDAAIDNRVEKAILISSDKACNPCTLYGYTKAVAERIFQQANIYSKNHSFKTGIVRYGNVANSKGSIIPLYKDLIQKKIPKLPVTDKKMTRFWFDVKDACKLIEFALQYSLCGEIFIPKLKSFKIIDLVKAFDKEYNIIGLRNIEKIHEQMISEYEKTFDIGKYYCIPANLKKFLNSPYSEFNEMIDEFEYDSEHNEFMAIEEIKEKLVDLN